MTPPDLPGGGPDDGPDDSPDNVPGGLPADPRHGARNGGPGPAGGSAGGPAGGAGGNAGGGPGGGASDGASGGASGRSGDGSGGSSGGGSGGSPGGAAGDGAHNRGHDRANGGATGPAGDPAGNPANGPDDGPDNGPAAGPAGAGTDRPPPDDILPDETFLRAADDPFAPGDLPLALLEFHSPTAALVNLPPTPAARHIVWIVGGLMACSLLGMTVFPLSRVVSTQGRLVSSQPTLLVQPFDTSIVRSITVASGDFVHKGDVLARLDPTQAGADSGNLKVQRAEYQAETDRLKAEASGVDYRPDPNDPASLTEAAAFVRRKAEFDATVGKYANQIASLQSDLQGYQASTVLYAARARVMADVLGMRQQLQKEQVGSRLSTLAARNDLMEVERAQVAAHQQADSARAKLAAQISEREGYQQNWKAEVYRDLVVAEHRLSEAQAGYSKAVLHDTMVLLRADEDAVVLSVGKMSVGSVVTPAQPVMTLVPTGQGLEIEAVMSGHDVGFVRLGDRALVKFATFPYQQYGGAEATVRTISADAFTPGGTDGPGQGNELTPENAAEAFYRVRLHINRYTLHGVPEFFHPMPGMVVSADIHVGKRTIMQYLLNTIVPLATTGMREP